jgi:hypothetical protein
MCASSTPVTHQSASRASPLEPERQKPILFTAASADMTLIKDSSSFKGVCAQSNAHTKPSTLDVYNSLRLSG